jgi:secondary thiamine-phosphate synthase enzyme
MKFSTRAFTVRTSKGPQFLDITSQVVDITKGSDVQNGFAIVFSRHTTAAIRINENEPMLLQDMEQFLARVAPSHAYYNHNDSTHNGSHNDNGEHPNGHSHCQQLLLGASEAIPIVEGDLLLGQWQRLFLVELDCGREREVVVQLVGE